MRKIEELAELKDFLLKCFHKDPEKRLICSELLEHNFLTDKNKD
jgi:serine/threonine protein kinase